ncbi:hypothetical protein [Streptomyces globosus]|uniref:hypothetical protein n=1 Tax=Streptomyces globosus TaxID=68209 RepID=UPI0031DE7A01
MRPLLRRIGFSLAPADRAGHYQGFFGTGVPLARSAGPVVVTSPVVLGGGPGWFPPGGLLPAASYATGPAVRWAERSRPGAVRAAYATGAPAARGTGAAGAPVAP